METSDRVRMRLGVRGAVPLFPNAAVFVVWVSGVAFEACRGRVEELRELLRGEGQSALAEKLICERS